MKSLLWTLVFSLHSALGALGQGADDSWLTERDTREIREKLEAFDKGKITLDQATEMGTESAKKMIAFYVLHTNEITVRMKLAVSRTYAGFGKFQEAAELARGYVNVYSNEWRGWDILGCAKLSMGEYGEALWAMTNAVRLGDQRNIVALGLAAVGTDRLDILREMVVPRFLVLKDAKDTSDEDKLDMVSVLVSYAVKADQKDVFIKALENVDAGKILSRRDDLKSLVKRGCVQFKPKEIEVLCGKISEALQDNSKTNR